MQAHHQKAAIQKLENDAFNYRGAKFLVLENVAGQRYLLSALMGGLQVPSSQIYFSASFGAIDSQAYDFVMIDTAMNDYDGARTVSDLRNRFPGATLLVLMNAHELTTATELLEAGGKDILVKEEFTPLQLHTTLLSTLKYGENMGQHRGYTDFQNMRSFYDATWDWDLNTSELTWGDGFCKTFGYGESDQGVTFSKWSKLIHPEDRDEVLRSLYEAISGLEDQWEMEYRFLRADGKYAHVKDKGILLKDDNGKSFRMVGVMEDITLRKEENHRLHLMESVVTNSEDAVMMVKEVPDKNELSITYVNEAFTRMTRYSIEDVKGQSPWILAGPDSNTEGLKQAEMALQNKRPCEFETISYKKNGEGFWSKVNLSPVENEQGKVTHWVCLAKDITEEKYREIENELFQGVSYELSVLGDVEARMEKILQKVCEYTGFGLGELWWTSRDNLHLHRLAKYAENHNAIGFYQSASNQNIVEFNEGLTGKAWATKSIVKWNKHDNDEVFVRVDSAKQNGFDLGYSVPILFDGKVIGVLFFLGCHSLNDPHKDARILNSLSSRLGAEFQRVKLEEELHRFFNLSPDILCIYGMDGYLKKVNPAFAKILGYTEEELLEKPFTELVHPEDIDTVYNVMEELNGKHTTGSYEVRSLAKDGTTKWISWTATSEPDERLIYAVAKEVTGKKKSEQLLEKRNEQLKTAQRIAKMGYWTHDLVKNKSDWSEELFIIWEQDPEKFVPGFDTLLETIHPDDRHMFLKSAEGAFPNKKYYDNEHRIITPSGKIKWIFERITLYRDDKNNPILMEGIAQDITEEKKITGERDKVLDSITDGFLAVNKDWEVTFWNNAAEQILKIRREDIIGKDFWEEFQNYVDEPFYEELQQAMKSGRPHSFEGYYEMLGMWFETSTYPVDDGLSIFLKDITNSKRQALEIINIKNNREALINSTEDLIWSLDLEGRLISANKAFKSMAKDFFGEEFEEGSKLEFADLDEEGTKRWNEYYRRAFEGEKFTITEEGNFGERTIYSLISFNPIWDDNGNCVGVACFSKNITERMTHLKAIEQQNEKLRNIAWTQSHVVRAPLARIMGLTQYLNSEESMDDTDRSYSLDNIWKSAKELDNVVHNMVSEAEELNLVVE